MVEVNKGAGQNILKFKHFNSFLFETHPDCSASPSIPFNTAMSHNTAPHSADKPVTCEMRCRDNR